MVSRFNFFEVTYLSQHKLVKHGIHFVDYQPNNKALQYSHHVIATSIFLHPVKHKGGRHIMFLLM